MTNLSFEGVTGRFPKTVLEETQTKRANPDISLVERFTLIGLTSVLQSDPSRKTRTAEIAREGEVTEATLFRHVPKPVIETLAIRALDALRNEFYAPRHGALLEVAAQLAIDDSIDFPMAVSAWSKVYGAIANPASVYHAGLSQPHEASRLMSDHASMLTKNVKLLGVRSGAQVDDRLGVRVIPAVAAYDMTEGMTELGQFTEATILRTLRAA